MTTTGLEDAAAVEVDDEPHTDETPALNGVVPEVTEDLEERHPALDTLPSPRSLKGTLPSARMSIKIKMMEFSEMLEGLKNVDQGNIGADKLSRINAAFESVEQFLVDYSSDPPRMDEWLRSLEENTESALMQAFQEYATSLGNQ